MYGDHRAYGYLYGGSGGSMKTIAGFEGAPDVWDGAVPFVMGIPQSMPNTFSSQALAIRVLRDMFPQIVDATEPGGSGDIYDGLTVDERQVLAEVTRLGFPPDRGSTSTDSPRATPACGRCSPTTSRGSTPATSTTSGPCPATSATTRRSHCSMPGCSTAPPSPR